MRASGTSASTRLKLFSGTKYPPQLAGEGTSSSFLHQPHLPIPAPRQGDRQEPISHRSSFCIHSREHYPAQQHYWPLRASVCCKAPPGDALRRPLIHGRSAKCVIELDRRRVPVEHPPFQSWVSTLNAERREIAQQRFFDKIPASAQAWQRWHKLTFSSARSLKANEVSPRYPPLQAQCSP